MHPAERLDAFCRSLLSRCGVPEGDAADVGEVLVRANLRGVDTHGVFLMDYCLRRLRAGGANPAPNVRILGEGPCTACWDADRALGQVAGMRAMRAACDKAAAAGIGYVAVRNSSHTGPMGPYVLIAAERGLVGIGITNTVPAMALSGTASRSAGNNVIALACPGDPWPWLFDACLGATSWGKVRQAKRRNEPIPGGMVVDVGGAPITDPDRALSEGLVLPIGGHKGSGLTLFIDILTAVLAGGTFSGQLPWAKAGEGHPHQYSHAFAAIDVARFRPIGEFQAHLAEVARFLKEQPKAAGVEEIRIPGERQHAEELRRRREGIPVEPAIREMLNGWAERLGIGDRL